MDAQVTLRQWVEYQRMLELLHASTRVRGCPRTAGHALDELAQALAVAHKARGFLLAFLSSGHDHRRVPAGDIAILITARVPVGDLSVALHFRVVGPMPAQHQKREDGDKTKQKKEFLHGVL